MTHQNFEGDSATAGKNGAGESTDDALSGRFAGASDAVREAGAKISDTMSEATAAVTDHFKDMLDQQISNHIGAVGQIAGSVKRAAADIEEKSPLTSLTSSLVRSLSGKVEQFAENYEDETVDQLIWSASDFTRRQPALVFGIAAFAGFLVFRTIKNVPAGEPAPPIQPTNNEYPV
jgi:hypothetical protein